MIPNNENVARAIFSPKMVISGEIMPEAFDGQKLIGGKTIDMPESEIEQDFLLLAIQRELVDIAQKGLYII